MEFLLEIGTEEMPSSHLKAGLSQLQAKLKAELVAAGIRVRSLQTFGTCRRLVVRGEFAARQDDKEEVVIGPPRSAAFASDGSPTAAAEGFARSQKTEVDKLQVVQTPRGEYVASRNVTRGGPTSDILANALP
ncbi:MAG: glycine--tRNA ligase subunit beta, partial [Acidobacteriota bacterium]